MVYVKCILLYIFMFLKLTSSNSFPSFDNIFSAFQKVIQLELCNNLWIPNNFTALEQNIQDNFYGQPIATMVTLNALKNHIESSSPSKNPLILSFHGGVGVGKTYLIEFIVNSLYLKGLRSKYVHSYVGSMHFPLAKNLAAYEDEIHKTILEGAAACPRSLFIFDEVHKLQPGLLDKISSLIRCAKLGKCSDLSKSIFIFISNTGEKAIMEKTIQSIKGGLDRSEFKLREFETALIDVANQKGGLQDSDLIKYSLIDHFVPFLPLERTHIEDCIKTELYKMNVEESLYLIEEVTKEAIMFGPEPENLFSLSGCKRISQKLGVLVLKSNGDFLNNKIEL